MRGFTKIASAFILSLGFLLVGCNFKTDEYCDMQGGVYLAIVNNADEWSSYFSASPNPASVGIIFYANGERYQVLYLAYQHSQTQPVLFVSTRDGWPSTPLGMQGYFYTANGEFSWEGYEIERLSDNISCYRKKGATS
jgi:hypothetical protein